MRAAVPALLGAALLTAGCGGTNARRTGEAAKPTKQILADAQHAVAEATSTHVAGRIVEGGQPYRLNLSFERGSRAAGSLWFNRNAVDFIRIGRTVYIRGDAAVWKRAVGSAAARQLQGKWLTVPANKKGFPLFRAITKPSTLFKAMLSRSAIVANDGYTTYDGQKVVELEDSVGARLYIAAAGPPYPLALVGSGPGVGGDLTFDRWDAPVSIKPPKGAIDVSKLSSMGA